MMNWLAWLAVVGSAVYAAPGGFAAPATQPTPQAAARAAKLRANVKTFQLHLSYHGDQDKPYYDLLLSAVPVPFPGANPFSPTVAITQAQAEKIISHLGASDFLDQSVDVSNQHAMPPDAPCYTIRVRYSDGNDTPEFYERLGWGRPLLARLDGLRGVLDGNAADAMDLLTNRLAGHRREWEKQAAARAEADAAVAAEIARLSDANPSVRAAAAKRLATIGEPATPALVHTLSDNDNQVRGCAAEALRAILAAHPTAAPDRQEKAYWERLLANVAVGMTLDEALASLLPPASPEARKAALQMGAWSGQSGFSICRLDDYWTATLQLVDADREKIGQSPVLNPSVRPVWVQPPANYSGPWVAWFVNGQKAHEMQYRAGQYDGTFTAFHDDGSPSYEQHYRNGVADGADTGWDRGGRKVYEGRYTDGKQEGRWQHWYADGTPQSVADYSGGKLDGVYAMWFPSGVKQYERHYLDGRQEGLDLCWDERGKVLWTRTYRNGELVETP